MNDSGRSWTIHELRLPQMQDMEGEAVVYYRETRQSAADGVRSTRLEGKRCRSYQGRLFRVRDRQLL
jgi:hypothetical protein